MYNLPDFYTWLSQQNITDWNWQSTLSYCQAQSPAEREQIFTLWLTNDNHPACTQAKRWWREKYEVLSERVLSETRERERERETKFCQNEYCRRPENKFRK